ALPFGGEDAALAELLVVDALVDRRVLRVRRARERGRRRRPPRVTRAAAPAAPARDRRALDQRALDGQEVARDLAHEARQFGGARPVPAPAERGGAQDDFLLRA